MTKCVITPEEVRKKQFKSITQIMKTDSVAHKRRHVLRSKHEDAPNEGLACSVAAIRITVTKAKELPNFGDELESINQVNRYIEENLFIPEQLRSIYEFKACLAPGVSDKTIKETPYEDRFEFFMYRRGKACYKTDTWQSYVCNYLHIINVDN